MKYTVANICRTIVWACCWVGTRINLVLKVTRGEIIKAWSKRNSFLSNILNFVSKNRFNMDTSELCPICWDKFGTLDEGKETKVRLVEGEEIKFFEIKDHGEDLIIKTSCGHVFHMKCLKHWLYTRKTLGVSEEEWASYFSNFFENYENREGEKIDIKECVEELSWNCPSCKRIVVPTECRHMWYTVTDNDKVQEEEKSQTHELKLAKIQELLANRESLFMKFESSMVEFRQHARLADDALNHIRSNSASIKESIEQFHEPEPSTSPSMEIGNNELVKQDSPIPEFLNKKSKIWLRILEECDDEFDSMFMNVMENGIENKLQESTDLLRRTVSHLLKPRSAESQSTLLSDSDAENPTALENDPVVDSEINNVSTSSIESNPTPRNNRDEYEYTFPPPWLTIRNWEPVTREEFEFHNANLGTLGISSGVSWDLDTTDSDSEEPHSRTNGQQGIPTPGPNNLGNREALTEASESHFSANAEPTFMDRVRRRVELQQARQQRRETRQNTHETGGTRQIETVQTQSELVGQSPFASSGSVDVGPSTPDFPELEEIAMVESSSAAPATPEAQDTDGAWGGIAPEHIEYDMHPSERSLISELKKMSLADNSSGSSRTIPQPCHDNIHTCQGLESGVPIGSRIVFRKNNENIFGKVVRDINVCGVLWVGVEFDKNTDGLNFRDAKADALETKNCMMIPVCRLRADSRFSIFEPSDVNHPDVIQAGFIIGTVKLGDRIIWYGEKNEAKMGTVKWLGFKGESLDLIAGVEFEDEVEDTNPGLTRRLFSFERKHGGLVPVNEMVKYSDFMGDN